MTDEKWNKDNQWVLDYLQELIDFYCYDSKLFKSIEDITPDTCSDFWKIVLRQYQYYNIPLWYLEDLDDALRIYFGITYPEFKERAYYPEDGENDRRNLALYIGNYLQIGNHTIILPEEVPLLFDYLDTPSGIRKEADKILDEYLDQFDGIARNEEYDKRYKLIDQERIEAIASRNKPMPIRPMGMKLDLCYKKPKE